MEAQPTPPELPTPDHGDTKPTENQTHQVDPERFKMGTWSHQFNRQVGQGDIRKSYSADRIGMEGRVRKPFKFKDQLWVNTGRGGGAGTVDNQTITAYRLIPIDDFDGDPTTYHQKTRNSDIARSDPNGFYHGMTVKYKNKDHILIGPSVTFTPGKVQQLALFEMGP